MRRTAIYAIVETGGKQYTVTPGQKIKVEKLPETKGDTVELGRVLLVSADEQVMVGKPTVEGALVTATRLGEGKGKKIVIFRYKNKTRYRKKTGHRQPYTELEITDITAPGIKTEAKPKRAAKAASKKE